MWDIFEQPWTLLGAAVIVLFVVLTYRSVLPEKQKWRHWLLPIAVGALGIGLDALVATDLEKVDAVVKSSLQAVEAEDCPAIARLITGDYQDSYHTSKEALLRRCRDKLTPPAVESIKKLATARDVSAPRATVTFTMLMKFDKESYWARSYKPTALVKIQIYLRKQRDKSWLIHRIEVVEVDKMPITWRVT